MRPVYSKIRSVITNTLIYIG